MGAAISVAEWTPTSGAPRQAWDQCAGATDPHAFYCDPRWLDAICEGLQHQPYLLEARRDGRVVGLLSLSFIRSLLFGRFLVSLPYVNTAGVLAKDDAAATALIDRAVELADKLDVRYLELRHERRWSHPALTHQVTSKVHMRLQLPSSAEELWRQFKPKVRNQIRKGEKQLLTVHWGREELLADFYTVFCRNMRDLGTPVYGRQLFASILNHFPERAELCVVQLQRRPVAAGLLVHGDDITQVPSASSLRRFNPTNCNMLMYWHLLKRSVERGQTCFDFGRSSPDSNTFRFKKQWGAQPVPAIWQYYLRKGSVQDMRLEAGHYDRWVRIWRWLPVGLTRIIGPRIVRGIP